MDEVYKRFMPMEIEEDDSDLLAFLPDDAIVYEDIGSLPTDEDDDSTDVMEPPRKRIRLIALSKESTLQYFSLPWDIRVRIAEHLPIRDALRVSIVQKKDIPMGAITKLVKSIVFRDFLMPRDHTSYKLKETWPAIKQGNSLLLHAGNMPHFLQLLVKTYHYLEAVADSPLNFLKSKLDGYFLEWMLLSIGTYSKVNRHYLPRPSDEKKLLLYESYAIHASLQIYLQGIHGPAFKKMAMPEKYYRVFVNALLTPVANGHVLASIIGSHGVIIQVLAADKYQMVITEEGSSETYFNAWRHAIDMFNIRAKFTIAEGRYWLLYNFFYQALTTVDPGLEVKYKLLPGFLHDPPTGKKGHPHRRYQAEWAIGGLRYSTWFRLITNPESKNMTVPFFYFSRVFQEHVAHLNIVQTVYKF